MPENPILDWFTDSNTFFLLGAGSSTCAQKPLMDDLTTTVLAKLQEPATSLFAELEGRNGRRATVEDLLNQVLQLKSLLASRKEKKLDKWELTTCDANIKTILSGIVKAVGCNWEKSTAHGGFLKRLASHAGRKVCDIFTLNYDVVIEATLEDLGFPCSAPR